MAWKQINDTLGHAAGDKALVEIGRVLAEVFTTRCPDSVFRVGGDEFCVLLSGCGATAEKRWRQKRAESECAETGTSGNRRPPASPGFARMNRLKRRWRGLTDKCIGTSEAPGRFLKLKTKQTICDEIFQKMLKKELTSSPACGKLNHQHKCLDQEMRNWNV